MVSQKQLTGLFLQSMAGLMASQQPIPNFNVKVEVEDEPVLSPGFEIPPGFTAADKGRRFLPDFPPSQPSSIEATPKPRPKKRNKPPVTEMPRRSLRLQKIREATVGLRRSPRLQKIREAAIGPRRSMRLKEKRDRCS